MFSEGINIFLDGFVPTENLRFRETSLIFKVAESAEFVSHSLIIIKLIINLNKQEDVKKMRRYSYPDMKKRLGSFQMEIQSGGFTDSEIIVMLGENGTGKTTFIRLMAGLLKPDHGGMCDTSL